MRNDDEVDDYEWAEDIVEFDAEFTERKAWQVDRAKFIQALATIAWVMMLAGVAFGAAAWAEWPVGRAGAASACVVVLLALPALGLIWRRAKFCEVCDCCTQIGQVGVEQAWCPNCDHLIRAESILCDPPGILCPTSSESLGSSDPAFKVFNLLLLLAIKDKASELVLTPTEDDIRPVVIIDSMGYEVFELPKMVQSRLTRLAKVIARLDPRDSNHAEHGHFGIVIGDETIESDINFEPSAHGLKITVRFVNYPPKKSPNAAEQLV